MNEQQELHRKEEKFGGRKLMKAISIERKNFR
jgi:hypothetical protein